MYMDRFIYLYLHKPKPTHVFPLCMHAYAFNQCIYTYLRWTCLLTYTCIANWCIYALDHDSSSQFIVTAWGLLIERRSRRCIWRILRFHPIMVVGIHSEILNDPKLGFSGSRWVLAHENQRIAETHAITKFPSIYIYINNTVNIQYIVQFI